MADYSARQTDYVLDYTAYISHGELVVIARRHGRLPSIRYTRQRYLEKLRQLTGRRAVSEYSGTRWGCADWLASFGLRYVSGATVFLEKSRADSASRARTPDTSMSPMTARRRSLILLVIAAVSLPVLYVVWYRELPLTYRADVWSIGIYTGSTPVTLGPDPRAPNPVLTAAHVTDIKARFVADPFMIRKDAAWYMFFEILNADTREGDIGYATSADGFAWRYGRVVLDEPFHLSYPYVFEADGEYYMIPETAAIHSIRLYKAVSFPDRWIHVATLATDNRFVDSSIVRVGKVWWLFSSAHWGLRLFWSEQLVGPYRQHPQSPLIANDRGRARPAGRVVATEGRLIRFVQDASVRYGRQVHAFEIVTLTRERYEEREVSESPVVKASGSGWNAAGMHHVDPHLHGTGVWIASVDGVRVRREFGFKPARRRPPAAALRQ